MNYYYYPNSENNFFSSSSLGNISRNPEFVWLLKNYKRILFSFVAVYLSFQLVSVLLRFFSFFYCSLFVKAVEKKEEEIVIPTEITPPSISGTMKRTVENLLVTILGLTVGMVAYYVHLQPNSFSFTLKHFRQLYSEYLKLILYYTMGIDLRNILSNANISSNEALISETILVAAIFYVSYRLILFLLRHYLFAFALAILGFVLYFYQFPITPNTARTYSGTMFLIDRHQQTARFVPNVIPKLLIVLTTVYYLFLLLLKSFTLFLKMTLRLALYSIIFSILIHSLSSILNANNSNIKDGSGSPKVTTFIPNHHQY